MNKIILLFIFIFLINIIKGDSTTLFVNPTTGNNSTQCGSTTQNACQSILYALNSFTTTNNNINNNTSLTLQLMDGIYIATNNSILTNSVNITTLNINSFSNNNNNVILQGFSYQYPFLNYYDRQNINYTLSVNNITFVNSSYILYSNSSTLNVTFNGCVFRDIDSNLNVLIWVSSSKTVLFPFINILNSQFSNISVNGQSMVNTYQYTLILSNVSVINCSAYQVFTMYGDGEFSNVTMIGANSDDGSPMNLDVSNYLTITDSSFSNNTGAAGVINFLDEMSYRVVIQNTNFTANSGTSSGALNLARNNGGSYFISNCNFISNQCSNNGGAITAVSKRVTIQYSTFIGNSATNGGGAFYGGYPTSVIFNQCILKNNSADTGGAIYLSLSSLTLNTDTFISNNATHGNDVLCSSSNINVNPPNSMVTSNYWCPDSDCTFKNNQTFHCPTTYHSSSSSNEKNNSTDSNSNSTPHKKGLDKKDIIIAIVVPLSVVGFIFILILICVCRRRRLYNTENFNINSGGNVYHHVERSPLIDHRHHTPGRDNHHHHHHHTPDHHHGGHHHHHHHHGHHSGGHHHHH